MLPVRFGRNGLIGPVFSQDGKHDAAELAGGDGQQILRCRVLGEGFFSGNTEAVSPGILRLPDVHLPERLGPDGVDGLCLFPRIKILWVIDLSIKNQYCNIGLWDL